MKMTDTSELENLLKGDDAAIWLEEEIAKHDSGT